MIMLKQPVCQLCRNVLNACKISGSLFIITRKRRDNQMKLLLHNRHNIIEIIPHNRRWMKQNDDPFIFLSKFVNRHALFFLFFFVSSGIHGQQRLTFLQYSKYSSPYMSFSHFSSVFFISTVNSPQ